MYNSTHLLIIQKKWNDENGKNILFISYFMLIIQIVLTIMYYLSMFKEKNKLKTELRTE